MESRAFYIYWEGLAEQTYYNKKQNSNMKWQLARKSEKNEFKYFKTKS